MNGVFVADPGGLGILMSNHLVEPIAQAVLRPFPAELRAVSPADQVRVEQTGIGIDLIPDHAATISLDVEKTRATGRRRRDRDARSDDPLRRISLS